MMNPIQGEEKKNEKNRTHEATVKIVVYKKRKKWEKQRHKIFSMSHDDCCTIHYNCYVKSKQSVQTFINVIRDKINRLLYQHSMKPQSAILKIKYLYSICPG